MAETIINANEWEGAFSVYRFPKVISFAEIDLEALEPISANELLKIATEEQTYKLLDRYANVPVSDDTTVYFYISESGDLCASITFDDGYHIFLEIPRRNHLMLELGEDFYVRY